MLGSGSGNYKASWHSRPDEPPERQHLSTIEARDDANEAQSMHHEDCFSHSTLASPGVRDPQRVRSGLHFAPVAFTESRSHADLPLCSALRLAAGAATTAAELAERSSAAAGLDTAAGLDAAESRDACTSPFPRPMQLSRPQERPGLCLWPSRGCTVLVADLRSGSCSVRQEVPMT